MHPHISTVTYLTGGAGAGAGGGDGGGISAVGASEDGGGESGGGGDGGGGAGGGGDSADGAGSRRRAQAPTVVLEGLTVPTLARHGHSAPAGLPAAPRATGVCASFPEAGKHIAFDGRLLHGVLREVLPADEGAAGAAAGAGDSGGGGGGGGGGERRVTFLGNVWLNHWPKGVKPLPEGLLPALRPPSSSPPATAAPVPLLILEPGCAPPPPQQQQQSTSDVSAADAAAAGDAEGWATVDSTFGWSGDELRVGGRLPLALLRGRGPGAGTVRVHLPPAALVTVVHNDRRAEGGGGGGGTAGEDAGATKRPRFA